ncbi:MAG TPA: hypothetical protein VGI82_05050 [Chitinophagaceae bacterium]
MKKNSLLACLFCFAFMTSHVHAQSINNRDWVASFGDPINDSLTFHIKSDSSVVTTSKGEIIIHTTCKISGDTLTILDIGSGEHSCPDMVGKYKVNLSGDSFTMTLIEDACDGRGQVLNGARWTEVRKK